MQVNSVTGTSGSSKTGSAKGLNLDSNAFMQLFLAQLKNQDPTSPMDTTAYMQQMATMTQVEQSAQSNSKLDTMLQKLSMSQAEGLVGRTVSSMDGKISGKVQSVSIYSDGTILNLDNGSAMQLSDSINVS